MKKLKKLAMFLLTLCLTVPCFSVFTYAAEGKIMFTDPSTAVGETLEVKGVVAADSAIEDMTVVMSYDTEMLKFKKGDNVTETTDGKLTFEILGEEHENRVEFYMYFDVLSEGSTTIQVVSHNTWLANDERLECAEGSSTVTIAAGDPSAVTSTDTPTDSSSTVEVSGKTYTLSSDFEKSEIPDGYVETTLRYAGAEYRTVVNESTGIQLGYLVDSNSEGEFFMYVSDNATFAPYEQIKISDTTSIILLSDVSGITLPDTYASTTVTVNGHEFPAWQDTENTEMCILYAVNNSGVKALYQYDSSEKTYQKFDAPETDGTFGEDSFIGQLATYMQNHMDTVILVTGLGFIIFLIIIIVLSVKLFNRNAELDEIYEKFDIDFGDDEEDENLKKAETKGSGKEDEDEKGVIRLDDDQEAGEDEIVDEDIVIVDDKDEDVVQVKKDEFDEDEDEEELFSPKPAFRRKENLAKNRFFENREDNKVEMNDEGEFYDDDDDSDFEFDFIDLDD